VAVNDSGCAFRCTPRRRDYNAGSTSMGWYIALYLVGMLGGLAASIAFDVQLRRPGMRQGVGLVMFAFLVWGALAVSGHAFTDVLLPSVWVGTGLLAGLGSREPRQLRLAGQ